MEDTSSIGGKISGASNSASVLSVNAGATAYLFFDLSELDSARPLRSARLRLYFAGVSERGAGIGVHAVTSPWAEGNAVTVNAPQYTTKAMASIAAEDVASRSFASVDVTALVNGWIKNPNSNNGFALVPLSGAKLAKATIASKERIGMGMPAMLDIELGETDSDLLVRLKPTLVTDASVKGSVLSVDASTSVGELRFQWYRDGTAVEGANKSTFDAKGYPGSYFVRIGNGVSGTTIDSGMVRPVTVGVATILTQPVGGNLSASGVLNLSVNAEGTGPLVYQWNKDGVAITGATGASFDAKEAGNYTVAVSNSGGTVISGAAAVNSRVRVLSGEMIMVKGGTLPSESRSPVKLVGDFQIGKYEVTWGEWKAVRAWATANGYDLAGSGAGSDDDHPVWNLSLVEMAAWCNAKSERDGLTPAYWISTTNGSSGTVWRSRNADGVSQLRYLGAASGYRLPLIEEWEWAARGGANSMGYMFSGSNDPNEVGWFFENSSGALIDMYRGRGTWPVGRKKPNELGLYDMSGNVSESCWSPPADYRAPGVARFGTDFTLFAGDIAAYGAFMSQGHGGNRGFDGFRLARSLTQ